MTQRYWVETEPNSWSTIHGPNGYREEFWRYRWEAEEYAGKLERGEIAELSRNGEFPLSDAERRAPEERAKNERMRKLLDTVIEQSDKGSR